VHIHVYSSRGEADVIAANITAGEVNQQGAAWHFWAIGSAGVGWVAQWLGRGLLGVGALDRRALAHRYTLSNQSKGGKVGGRQR